MVTRDLHHAGQTSPEATAGSPKAIQRRKAFADIGRLQRRKRESPKIPRVGGRKRVNVERGEDATDLTRRLAKHEASAQGTPITYRAVAPGPVSAKSWSRSSPTSECASKGPTSNEAGKKRNLLAS